MFWRFFPRCLRGHRRKAKAEAKRRTVWGPKSLRSTGTAATKSAKLVGRFIKTPISPYVEHYYKGGDLCVTPIRIESIIDKNISVYTKVELPRGSTTGWGCNA